jgi:hypothetical protein
MNKIRYFDADTKKVVRIPARELAPDAVLSRVAGIEGEVWTQPSDGKQAADGEPNGFKHSPFNESVRIYIEQIQAAFAEHYPLTFDEWEDGFRRDDNASQQIAVWWYAADIYKAFAAAEPSEYRRCDIYRCIFSCMISSRETVWDIYQPHTISRSEAEKIVERYFMITPLDGATKTDNPTKTGGPTKQIDGADGHA